MTVRDRFVVGKFVRMFAALLRDFRIAPITFVMLAASVVLFFVVEFSRSGENAKQVDRPKFGLIESLAFVDEKEISGPFDLWSGPWWRWLRIPASAFHHANLMHLFFNVSSLWLFGPLLERRIRRPAYLGFWFFAATVPFIAEYYIGHTPVGLSGVGCAMFGWCLVRREVDRDIAFRVHDGVVRGTWTFLFGFIIATVAGWINIANVAHFVGVGYGWLNAQASLSRRRRLFWIASHALIPLAIWGLLHPFWNGRYHAFLGRQAASLGRNHAAGVPHFQEAVRRDPNLPKVWMTLAEVSWNQGDRTAGWKLALEGLKHNPSSDALTEFTRDVWKHFPAAEQIAAKDEVRRSFGSDANAWLLRLNMTQRLKIDPSETDSAAEGRTL